MTSRGGSRREGERVFLFSVVLGGLVLVALLGLGAAVGLLPSPIALIGAGGVGVLVGRTVRARRRGL